MEYRPYENVDALNEDVFNELLNACRILGDKHPAYVFSIEEVDLLEGPRYIIDYEFYDGENR